MLILVFRLRRRSFIVRGNRLCLVLALPVNSYLDMAIRFNGSSTFTRLSLRSRISTVWIASVYVVSGERGAGILVTLILVLDLAGWPPSCLAAWPPGHLAAWPPGFLSAWLPERLDTLQPCCLAA